MRKTDNTLPDIKTVSQKELAFILYHIAVNTAVSQKYTRKFIEEALLRASDLLYKAYEGDRKGETIKLHQDQREGAYSNTPLSDLVDVTHRLITECRYHGQCEDMADHDQVCVTDSVTKCRCCSEGQLRCFTENFDWNAVPDEPDVLEVPIRTPMKTPMGI